MTLIAHDTTPAELVARAKNLKEAGHRLVTATAFETADGAIEILYHFDKDLELVNLRLAVPPEGVPSISGVYEAAFLVENEIAGQFGVSFSGLAIDFEGSLFLEREVAVAPLLRYGVAAGEKKRTTDEAEAAGPGAPGKKGGE